MRLAVNGLQHLRAKTASRAKVLAAVTNENDNGRGNDQKVQQSQVGQHGLLGFLFVDKHHVLRRANIFQSCHGGLAICMQDIVLKCQAQAAIARRVKWQKRCFYFMSSVGRRRRIVRLVVGPANIINRDF